MSKLVLFLSPFLLFLAIIIVEGDIIEASLVGGAIAALFYLMDRIILGKE